MEHRGRTVPDLPPSPAPRPTAEATTESLPYDHIWNARQRGFTLVGRSLRKGARAVQNAAWAYQLPECRDETYTVMLRRSQSVKITLEARKSYVNRNVRDIGFRTWELPFDFEGIMNEYRSLEYAPQGFCCFLYKIFLCCAHPHTATPATLLATSDIV